MRAPLAACLLFAAHAAAQTAHAPQPGAPKLLGKFGQWQAATQDQAGVRACFVFTRAEASPQHIPGRGSVVLSVTRRPHAHDVAALSAGFTIAGHEDATLQTAGGKILFYIAGRSAFARDNAAAIAAFSQAGGVNVKLPGPRGVLAADRFSLKGFSAAYAALNTACPP